MGRLGKPCACPTILEMHSFGLPWLVAVIALALHVADEAAHDFLSWYNLQTLRMRRYFGGIPFPPTFTFWPWLSPDRGHCHSRRAYTKGFRWVCMAASARNRDGNRACWKWFTSSCGGRCDAPRNPGNLVRAADALYWSVATPRPLLNFGKQCACPTIQNKRRVNP